MSDRMHNLIEQLNCDDPIGCRVARGILVKMGGPAIKPLIDALSSKKFWVRWEAAKALGQIGDSEASDALVKALEDREFDIRWLSAEALINIGSEVLIPLLEALINKPDSVWLREGAHHVLHDMDRGSLDNVLVPLMKSLEDANVDSIMPPLAAKALDAVRVSKRPEPR
ncbi:MAG: HEAT repeat domain-containing protein [Chloroflexota bacterium]